MARTPFFILGFVALVASAPARGQGLLEAFVEGFVEGMNDGGNGNGGFNDGGFNNGGFNNGGFDDGDGGYHHHNHHHHNNGYVNPYPSNYYPSNSYTPAYPSPRVVTPAVVQNSLPYKGPGVTIVLEEEEGGAVTHVVDGKEWATIQPGQQQKRTAKGSFEIRFSRGAAPNGQSYGEARYTLGEGTYFFTVTERGWDLLRDPSQPAVATPQAKPASPSGLTTTPLPAKGAPQPGAAAKQPSDL